MRYVVYLYNELNNPRVVSDVSPELAFDQVLEPWHREGQQLDQIDERMWAFGEHLVVRLETQDDLDLLFHRITTWSNETFDVDMLWNDLMDKAGIQ